MVLFGPGPDGADAVTLHLPAPVMAIALPPVRLHGPDVVKVTVKPEGEAVAVTGTGVLPYCTVGNCGKLMVCEVVVRIIGHDHESA